MQHKIVYNPPELIKKLFSDFIWESSSNKILLTFDDGPIPETTPMILKKLNENRLKAAFFCVGENCEKYPELINNILLEGHLVANHTFHHKRITGLSRSMVEYEIDSFNDLFSERFNYKVKYFRPPHGRFSLSTSSTLRKKNLRNVMWSLLTHDYKNDLNLVKFAVKNYLQQNSIIVLHDSLKAKDIIIDSIDFILDESNKKKYEIGEPAECLK